MNFCTGLGECHLKVGGTVPSLQNVGVFYPPPLSPPPMSDSETLAVNDCSDRVYDLPLG